MTTTRTPALTRRRRMLAIRIISDLRSRPIPVPDTITAREASAICADYLTITPKYDRMRESAPIRLVDVAVYIARYMDGGRRG